MTKEEQETAAKAAAEAKANAEESAASAGRAEKAEKARLAEEAKTLVRMTKGGESLAVHPTCVQDHIAAGWKVAA